MLGPFWPCVLVMTQYIGRVLPLSQEFPVLFPLFT